MHREIEHKPPTLSEIINAKSSCWTTIRICHANKTAIEPDRDLCSLVNWNYVDAIPSWKCAFAGFEVRVSRRNLMQQIAETCHELVSILVEEEIRDRRREPLNLGFTSLMKIVAQNTRISDAS